MDKCCLQGFRWAGEAKGHTTTIAGLDCYVTGSNKDVAIMIVHDAFGWTFSNTRVLADHFAEEADATVYIPDFFGGEPIPSEVLLDQSRTNQFDIGAFLARNAKTIREPEIVKVAESLKGSYSRLGAVGYCYGGWAVFRLGAKGKGLVDCISTAHPSLLEKQELANIGVPAQILAPEFDELFTEELKAYSLEVLPKAGVPFDYQYFPGLTHGFAIRGHTQIEGERKGMERAKNAVVLWFRQWLH